MPFYKILLLIFGHLCVVAIYILQQFGKSSGLGLNGYDYQTRGYDLIFIPLGLLLSLILSFFFPQKSQWFVLLTIASVLIVNKVQDHDRNKFYENQRIEDQKIYELMDAFINQLPVHYIWINGGRIEYLVWDEKSQTYSKLIRENSVDQVFFQKGFAHRVDEKLYLLTVPKQDEIFHLQYFISKDDQKKNLSETYEVVFKENHVHPKYPDSDQYNFDAYLKQREKSQI